MQNANIILLQNLIKMKSDRIKCKFNLINANGIIRKIVSASQ